MSSIKENFKFCTDEIGNCVEYDRFTGFAVEIPGTFEHHAVVRAITLRSRSQNR